MTRSPGVIEADASRYHWQDRGRCRHPNFVWAAPPLRSDMIFGKHRPFIAFNACFRSMPQTNAWSGRRNSGAVRRAQGKFEEGIAAAAAVITENPGEPWAYKEIGFSTLYLGNPLGAIDWFAKADRLGPRDPARWTWLDGQGHALILLGRDEEAMRSLRAALDSNPNTVGTYALLASAYALAGHADKSRLALAQYQKHYPDLTVGSFRSLAPVPLKLTTEKYRQQFERLKDGLRKAGMPG